jgi:HK97 family phage portal protein
MTPFLKLRRLKGGASFAETKESAASGLGAQLFFTGPGAARWSGRRYDRFAEEGYRRNVIAHRAVRLIADGAAAVPWLLYTGEKEVAGHPLLALLQKPNPLMDGMAVMAELYGFLLIAGNAYLEAVDDARGRPAELYALRPDRMKVLPGAKGWPRGYEYSVGGRSHVFAQDAARGVSPVLHLKMFHPLDDHYGLSPMEAAAYGIDLHNAAAQWNKALLDNAARPSGALVYEPGEKGASLTQAQFDRLKGEMEAQFQGGANAGRPLLLEGGLKWQQLGMSPSDMDFIEAKHVSAREIALAFGVPPMLLGIPGDNTYANLAEANRALWRQTLIPLVVRVAEELNNWLSPAFEGATIAPDFDGVEALAEDRAALWARIGAADFLSDAEKREMLGLGIS